MQSLRVEFLMGSTDRMKSRRQAAQEPVAQETPTSTRAISTSRATGEHVMDDDRLTMKWRFPLTFAALTAAAGALAVALAGHLNLLALPAGLIAGIEQDEIDDIVSVLLVVGVAFLLDQVIYTRRVHNLATHAAERLPVVQVTVTAVQEIVNDGLKQLQLLRSDAEGHLPSDCLALFDDAIRETVTKLTALRDLDAHANNK
jgi:hypothetical protein